jgi:hypothetical protein
VIQSYATESSKKDVNERLGKERGLNDIRKAAA